MRNARSQLAISRLPPRHVALFVAGIINFGCSTGLSSRPCATMRDLRSVGTAAEVAAVERNAYPESCFLDSCKPAALNTPLIDQWGTPFRYFVSDDRQTYAIVSAGADRQLAVSRIDDVVGMQPHTTRIATQDIIFSNGVFLQYPSACVK